MGPGSSIWAQEAVSGPRKQCWGPESKQCLDSGTSDGEPDSDQEPVSGSRNQRLGPGTSVWAQEPMSGSMHQCIHPCLGPETSISVQQPMSGSRNQCLGPGTSLSAQEPVSGLRNQCLGPGTSVCFQEPVYTSRNQRQIKDVYLVALAQWHKAVSSLQSSGNHFSKQQQEDQNGWGYDCLQ